MNFWVNPKIILAAVILITSVVFDLRSKKIPNQFILVSGGLALVLLLVLDGRSGLWPAMASLLTACTFTFPMFSLRAIGGGDVKLILVLALLLSWNAVLTTVLAAMVWGAMLGLFRIVFSGKLREFSTNLLHILKRSRPPTSQLSQFPFTVAILFGFMTACVLETRGGLWM